MDEEYDYALGVGVVIIILGILGVFFNSTTFMFFCKFVPLNEAQVPLRIICIHLSLVDLLFSLSACCVRGPGFIWPLSIYGTDSDGPEPQPNRQCQALSLVAVWFLSDLNLLAVLPLSLFSFFVPSVKQVMLMLVGCWAFPIMEMIFIVVGLNVESLYCHYMDTYRRCAIVGEWDIALDYIDLVVFNIIPLLIHVAIWGYLLTADRCTACVQKKEEEEETRTETETVSQEEEEEVDGKRQQTLRFKLALFVIIPFVITWLPYFVVYAVLREIPRGPKAIIFCFFYMSIVLNPLILAYSKYHMRVLTEGCSSCCCPEAVVEVPPPIRDVYIVEPSSSDRIYESRPAVMASSSSEPQSSPQMGYRDNIQNFSSGTSCTQGPVL